MNAPCKFAARALVLVALALPAHLWAQSEIELEGAITRVDGTTIELFSGLVRVEALGAKIETDDDEDFTNISDMKVGTAVELEGTARPDGTIQARSLEVSEEKEEDAEVGGVIGTVDRAAQTFTIGPVVIAWNGGTKFRGLERPIAGQLVEVEVEVSGGRLVAAKVEREDADD
jgi:hypothetical protein